MKKYNLEALQKQESDLVKKIELLQAQLVIIRSSIERAVEGKTPKTNHNNNETDNNQ